MDGADVHLGKFPSVSNGAVVVSRKLKKNMFLSRLRIALSVYERKHVSCWLILPI